MKNGWILTTHFTLFWLFFKIAYYYIGFLYILCRDSALKLHIWWKNHAMPLAVNIQPSQQPRWKLQGTVSTYFIHVKQLLVFLWGNSVFQAGLPVTQRPAAGSQHTTCWKKHTYTVRDAQHWCMADVRAVFHCPAPNLTVFHGHVASYE